MQSCLCCSLQSSVLLSPPRGVDLPTCPSMHCAAWEGGPPDTTFIEDAVLELLKTRRILKCSYPYGFFLEPKSTKKEIYELMQVGPPHSAAISSPQQVPSMATRGTGAAGSLHGH
ncbi:Ankyrin repeat and IBR domain-containing protein 1 [Liparis tanakae]|uniref:Ankyrin repeat and IBR domain-containing protein 1 n=1 Tax=Liparis tanakae TaxID=230148 RepID=A0A4Z2F0A9_9TELE|nr:Ankyrin repeat and IBR domain-containing protein 1 [Liparis tanakae]